MIPWIYTGSSPRGFEIQQIPSWRDLWSLNLSTSCMVEESSLVCGKSAKFYTTSEMTAHSGSNSVSFQINFEYFSIRRWWSIKLHSPFTNWQVGKKRGVLSFFQSKTSIAPMTNPGSKRFCMNGSAANFWIQCQSGVRGSRIDDSSLS